MKTTRILLPLLVVLPALGAPGFTVTETKGSDSKLNLEFDTQYVEIYGFAPQVKDRVNASLKELVEFPRVEMAEFLDDIPAAPGAEPSEVSVGASVTFFSPELLSVSVSAYNYAGGAHGSSTIDTANYDLRTGKLLTVDALLADKQAALPPILRALKREFDSEFRLDEGRPTAADLKHVVVDQDGLTFMWDSGSLGAPMVMGPLVVPVSWAELGKAIDREGVLRSAIAAGSKRPSVDMGLGDDEPFDPEINAVEQRENYVRALEEQLLNLLTTMTVRERMILLRTDLWRSAEDGEELLTTLEMIGARDLADRVAACREQVRAKFDASAYANEGELEAAAMKPAFYETLQYVGSGRVMSGAEPLPVFADASGAGPAIAKLPHDTVVGVRVVATSGEFHQVLLADGRLGHVSRSNLLLETPVIDEQGRVYERADGSFSFGTPTGLPLIPKDGPKSSDPDLDALTDLVEGNGMSPPVNLVAIKREIGRRPAWLAVLEFSDLSDEHQLGEGQPAGNGQPRGIGGLDDKLPKLPK